MEKGLKRGGKKGRIEMRLALSRLRSLFSIRAREKSRGLVFNFSKGTF